MQTSFWDMNPSSPSNGTPTAAECSESEPQRDGSPSCGCMKETSGCSIHPNTRDEWIASMQASLVLILAALEIEPDSAKAQEAAFIEKCSGLLASYDHATCSWKTSAQSFLPGLDEYSETWPRSGMTVGGHAYQHRQPVLRTTGIGGGVWPTPNTQGWRSDGELAILGKNPTLTEGQYLAMSDRAANSKRRKYWPTPRANDALKCGEIDASNPRNDLPAAVKMWPTQTARDWRSPNTLPYAQRGGGKRGEQLPNSVGGNLNPTFVEWLMGWPLGWTASKLWGTVESRSKPQSHGDSWEAHEHRP